MKLKNVEELDGTEIAAVDVCGNSNSFTLGANFIFISDRRIDNSFGSIGR